MKMLKTVLNKFLKWFYRKFFKKHIKPHKIEEVELVAGGFVSASDVYCNPHDKIFSVKN